MIASQPANANYIELTGATARVSATPGTNDANARSVEVFMDFMLLAFPTSASPALMSILTTTTVLSPSIDIMVPITNTATSAAMDFTTARNGVFKQSATGTVHLGQRHRVLGVDDGDNVTAWLDGQSLGSLTGQANWTAAERARPIDFGSTLYLAFDSLATKYWPMRVYETWIKVNGSLILHYRPAETDADSTSVPDLSGRGLTGTIVGTLDTDYLWASAWNRVGTLEGMGA